MRNRNAAKAIARPILGRARNGAPALDRGCNHDGLGPFPDASAIRAGLQQQPAKRGGPAPGRHDARDFYLALAVWKLHQAFDDLPPTRRADRDRDECACSIVAEVAAELGILSSARYSTVAKAWERFTHLR